MDRIVNLTPHPITVVDAEGNVIESIPTSGTVRLEMRVERTGFIGKVPISKTVYGEAVGLPPYEKNGKRYIVSQLVKNAFPEREDLLVPAEMLRDKDGHIIGCQSLGW